MCVIWDVNNGDVVYRGPQVRRSIYPNHLPKRKLKQSLTMCVLEDRQGPPLNKDKVLARQQAQNERERAAQQKEEEGRAAMELLEVQTKARVEVKARVQAEMIREGTCGNA